MRVIAIEQLRSQIEKLQADLVQRPPLERIQALEKEYTNLEILLQGTQRENERCMTELERYVTQQYIYPYAGQLGNISEERHERRRWKKN